MAEGKPVIVRVIEDMSTAQVARELGVSTARVDQLLNAGALPYTVTVLGRLIDRKAVQELKDEREALHRASFRQQATPVSNPKLTKGW